MKNEKKVIKMIFKNLDKIYTVSVKASKQFGMNAISTELLRKTISMAKLSKDESSKELHDYIGKHNEMLDILYNTCVAYIKRLGAKQVPFEFLKKAIELIKDNIIKG